MVLWIVENAIWDGFPSRRCVRMWNCWGKPIWIDQHLCVLFAPYLRTQLRNKINEPFTSHSTQLDRYSDAPVCCFVPGRMATANWVAPHQNTVWGNQLASLCNAHCRCVGVVCAALYCPVDRKPKTTFMLNQNHPLSLIAMFVLMCCVSLGFAHYAHPSLQTHHQHALPTYVINI